MAHFRGSNLSPLGHCKGPAFIWAPALRVGEVAAIARIE